MEPVTTAGRGRGWGKNNQNASHGLRNPGNQSSFTAPEGDDWYDRISRLDINDQESITSPESPIANLILLNGPEESLEHLVKILQAAIEDRTFALKFLKIFENNTNSRSRLMQGLQIIYEKQEGLFKNNPVRFSNFVYLFSEAFHRLRYGPGSLSFLRQPLQIMYQKLLVLGDEDNIELALTQLAANGRELLDQDKNSSIMGDIPIYARKLLAKRELNTRTRVMLLLIIDLYHNKFLPLTGNLQKFYVSQLGQATLSRLHEDNVGSLTISTPESQDNAIDHSAMKPGILMTIPMIGGKQQRLVDTKFSPREDPSEQITNSVPRAIRGSGSKSDYPKMNASKHENNTTHKYDEGFDARGVYNERVNQAYGHDDRFSKDY